MIAIPIVLGLFFSVLVNGLADNLLREQGASFPSILIPRCHYCDSQRKVPDWSAVVSNLFLSGRCLRCGAPRPFRDLLVEAILWIGLPAVWMAGKSGAHDLLIGGFILAAFILFAVVDYEHRYVLVEVVLLVSLVVVLDGLTRGPVVFFRILGGGAAGFLIFLFLFFFGKVLSWLFRFGRGIEPLGFGDVILSALVGLVVGWPAVLLTVLTSIVIGGMAGIILLVIFIVRGKSPQNATMAYGPCLLISGLLVYFYGGAFAEGLINFLAVF